MLVWATLAPECAPPRGISPSRQSPPTHSVQYRDVPPHHSSKKEAAGQGRGGFVDDDDPESVDKDAAVHGLGHFVGYRGPKRVAEIYMDMHLPGLRNFDTKLVPPVCTNDVLFQRDSDSFLMSAPRDVRLLIYKDALSIDSLQCRRSWSALLQTSSTVYREARSVLYQESAFNICVAQDGLTGDFSLSPRSGSNIYSISDVFCQAPRRLLHFHRVRIWTKDRVPMETLGSFLYSLELRFSTPARR
ncbi:hypothetical protein Tdes44962_MAKER00281 [Teratosphaeria destructans]|uniref:Uncharacterized protein n=1 Tax=Teratosphaeria destructans TaxID=418781 RepID=A0A9W7W440_9PEZI|nr:hypothetical protein Tdes44962_MAKER00281 [Teratosphaeria destructans]